MWSVKERKIKKLKEEGKKHTFKKQLWKLWEKLRQRDWDTERNRRRESDCPKRLMNIHRIKINRYVDRGSKIMKRDR